MLKVCIICLLKLEENLQLIEGRKIVKMLANQVCSSS